MPLSSKELWQGYQSQRTELYKQVMILSVAGLGYNLTDRPPASEINWPPSSDWEVSTFCFFISLISTLAVFFFTSAHLRAQFKILDPTVKNRNFELPRAVSKVKFWSLLSSLASILMYLSFGLAMWYAVARFFG